MSARRRSLEAGCRALWSLGSVSAICAASLAACGADVAGTSGSDDARRPGAPRAGGRPPGPWHAARARARSDLTPEQLAEAEGLEALGYAAGTTAAEGEVGVTLHDAGRSQPGLNLVVSGHAPEVLLMDMQGNVVHTWRRDPDDVWPDGGERDGSADYFQRARVAENGDLLGIYHARGLVKLDRDSNVLWSYPGVVHHDLDLAADGRVVVLEHRARVVPWINAERPVLDDFIVWLDSRGAERRRLSLLACIASSPLWDEIQAQIARNYARGLRREEAGRAAFADLLAENPEGAANFNPAGDILHTNTLQVLDGSHAGRSGHFREGNLLISIRELHRIAIVDPEAESLVWSLSGSWRGQHEPRLLESGNLLVFDNYGSRERGAPGYSEVLELDPLDGQLLWSYRGERAGEFDSPTNGSCQRLANGNTLITESVYGRAFEVTPQKRIVWEFKSPHRAGAGLELVALLREVVRLPPAGELPWLRR